MMTLGIVNVRSELGVMIEMPSSELRRREAARQRVQPREQPFGARVPALEHGKVHHLVQEDGEIENRKALYEAQRNPDGRMIESNQGPGRQPDDCKLPRRDREMTPR